MKDKSYFFPSHNCHPNDVLFFQCSKLFQILNGYLKKEESFPHLLWNVSSLFFFTLRQENGILNMLNFLP